MNKAHAIWSLLPNGYAERDGDLVKLSLVVSLRVATDSGKLGDLPGLLDWPAQLRTFDTVNVLVDGATSPVQATVAGEPPRSELWKALFNAATPVQLEGGGEVGDLEGTASSVLFKPLNRALRAIYEGTTAAAARGDARAAAATSPLGTALSGLARWSQGGDGDQRAARAAGDEVSGLLDPANATADGLERAATLLRERGMADAAAVVPLIPVLQRLRGASGGSAQRAAKNPSAPAPGKLAGTRTADEADFHQILGMAAAHPELALPLGLRIDLTMPLSPGAHQLQVIGLPLQVSGGAPISHVVADADRNRRRFVMATQQGAPTEIVNGMLDLRADGAGAEKYVVTTMDVVGMTQQLDALARNPGTGGAPLLPPRRNVGITIAQVDRRATTVAHTVARGTLLDAGFGKPSNADARQQAAGGVGGEVELFADDVTAGYRVDVRTDKGEWRSLMRRLVTYRVGQAISKGSPPITLNADDEGVLDPMVAVEQRDAAGNPVLEIGEDLVTFDGYSLVARRPGPSLTTGADGRVTAAVPAPTGSTPHPLAMEVTVKPGTLPRLRYGSTYDFRMRAVDLAGNSIAPELCDPGQVSAPVVYRRLDPVPAPHVQLRAPLTAGESLLQLVVRSDGEDNPIGSVCERHLAAPRAWFELAERHGRFDAAIGERASAQDRERVLAIGALEAGSFLDTTVPDPTDPGGRRVPAKGLRVAVNADDPNPPTGTLEGLGRGVPLPSGEYVVLDSDDPDLPWLADPLATGVAVSGLERARDEGPKVLPYSGGWPVPSPVRLVAKPGTGDVPESAVTTVKGRQVLEVSVPPAATIETHLSSTLDEPGLDLMEIDLEGFARARALVGQEPLLTPRQPVTLVHAVRRPLSAPVVTSAPVAARAAGETTAVLKGSATYHSASTAKVDIVTSWQEVLDDGAGPIRTEQRSSTGGGVTVSPAANRVDWEVRQALGDTRRYDLSVKGRGTTRFREYFPPDTPADQLTRDGEGVQVSVPNGARPEAPVVDLAVPIFRWERKLEGGVLRSTRRTAGLRVWLERPWFTTGPGERLGVVVYRDQAAGQANHTTARHQRVSRWAGSSIDGFGTLGPFLTKEHFPGHMEHVADVTGPGQEVLGFEVHFDEASDRWYADVEFDLGAGVLSWFPFLRLAVVRFQPVSAPGCHASPVAVTVPAQLPPERTMEATAAGPETLNVQIAGRWMNNTVFEATGYDRAQPGSDVYTEATGSRQALSHPTFENTLVSTGSVSLRRRQPATGLVDRVVVRELERGDSLHGWFESDALEPGKPGPANRTVWMETIDPTPLLAAAPPAPPVTPPAPPAPPVTPPKPGTIRVPGKR